MLQFGTENSRRAWHAIPAQEVDRNLISTVTRGSVGTHKISIVRRNRAIINKWVLKIEISTFENLL